jgi:hypothetical protein
MGAPLVVLLIVVVAAAVSPVAVDGALVQVRINKVLLSSP